MGKTLFDNWDFIYENSEDISLHIEYFDEGKDSPSLIVDITPQDFKDAVGKDRAYHVDIDGSFDLTIHAIKDNEVYITLLMRTSEYGWKREQQYVLNKKTPSMMSKLNYFNKPHGFYRVFVKEWLQN